MKKINALLILLSLFLHLQAQGQTNTITGTVIDKTDNSPIELASIRVLLAKDSTYVTGTAAKTNGQFSVNVSPASYIVEVSFMGYKTAYINANAKSASVPLGKILLGENAVMLGETVITAKAVEIQVKGDTLEYNADSYKVQQSAVVEDLLKKMPGVEIDSEGKITVNGKEVKKMLVDGKEFFSDDPKVASKNLPAAMVSKLQVLDRKSDMAIMTGFDDGDEETVINLTIKPGMKEGLFGNAFAGYGSKERYEAGGMINYMRNETQMTALGGINNTNNAGFSDFASSMFSGNRPGRGLNFGGNNGVAKTINGGFNFATESSAKFKWNGDVRYGSVDNDVSSISNTIYTGTSRTERSTSWGNNRSDNFGANLRFEWALDSLTNIIFRPSFQYNKNQNTQISESSGENISNRFGSFESNSNYFSDGNGIKLNGTIDFSRKLNNKGRVLSFSVSGGLSDADSDGFNQTSSTYYYMDTALGSDSTSILDQRFFQDDKSHNWRAYASFVEPLGRSNFLQLTYNISNNTSSTDKRTFDNDGSGDYNIVASQYTRNVENDFLNQNISLNFKAVRAKYNYTIGIGIEPSSSKTKTITPDRVVDPGRKNYLSFAPNGQFNYMWDRRHNLRIDYRGTTNQPSTLQLFSGITSEEGANRTEGNPNLRPSFENRVNLRYQNFNSNKASMLLLFGRFSHISNDITSVVTQLESGGRLTTYENINGNMSGNLRMIYNTPLKNNKFSFNGMSNISYSQQNTFISTESSREKNTADTYGFQGNAGLNYRSDLIDVGLKGNFTYQDVKYSIASEAAGATYNYGGTADFTLYLPFNFTVQSDMQYSTNSGYSNGFQQEEWLWNASLSYDFLKAKNATIRLKMYDILQERSNISRSASAMSITDITNSTINSYFMVNFVYKFQIFKGGAKRENMEDGRGFGGPGRQGPPPGGFGGGRPF